MVDVEKYIPRFNPKESRTKNKVPSKILNNEFRFYYTASSICIKGKVA